MIVMLRLTFVPGQAEWISKKGEAQSRVALSDLHGPTISIFDIKSGSNDALATLATIHKAPVTCLRYNMAFDTVISTDSKGFIEYWGGTDYAAPSAPNQVSFVSKLDTDLFDLVKTKSVAKTIEISLDGSQFSLYCSDQRIRVFKFESAKLRRVYDESENLCQELQKSGDEMFKIEDMELGRRLAVEKEVQLSLDEPGSAFPNAVFDESGNFLIFSSILGIKVVNLMTNQVVRILGKVENERFLKLALFQVSLLVSPL